MHIKRRLGGCHLLAEDSKCNGRQCPDRCICFKGGNSFQLKQPGPFVSQCVSGVVILRLTLHCILPGVKTYGRMCIAPGWSVEIQSYKLSQEDICLHFYMQQIRISKSSGEKLIGHLESTPKEGWVFAVYWQKQASEMAGNHPTYSYDSKI